MGLKRRVQNLIFRHIHIILVDMHIRTHKYLQCIWSILFLEICITPKEMYMYGEADKIHKFWKCVSLYFYKICA